MSVELSFTEEIILSRCEVNVCFICILIPSFRETVKAEGRGSSREERCETFFISRDQRRLIISGCFRTADPVQSNATSLPALKNAWVSFFAKSEMVKSCLL